MKMLNQNIKAMTCGPSGKNILLFLSDPFSPVKPTKDLKKTSR